MRRTFRPPSAPRVALCSYSEAAHATLDLYTSTSYLVPDIDATREREVRWNRRRVEILHALLSGPSSMNILDFGCGAGGFFEAAAQKFRRVIGFDVNAALREAHRARGFEIIDSLDAVSELQIDVVTLFHVLEHVPEPWELLLDLRRRLPNVSTFVVETPNTDEALNSVFASAAYRTNHFNSLHVNYFSPATLAAVVERAGLSRGRNDTTAALHHRKHTWLAQWRAAAARASGPSWRILHCIASMNACWRPKVWRIRYSSSDKQSAQAESHRAWVECLAQRSGDDDGPAWARRGSLAHLQCESSLLMKFMISAPSDSEAPIMT